MLERCICIVDAALIEYNGYATDVESARNFGAQIPEILKEVQEDINEQFDKLKPFRWNKQEGRYSKNTKAPTEWIRENGYADRWLLTDSKDLSLSLDAWGQHFQFQHNYPRGNYGAQYVRFLKLNQSISSFVNKGGKEARTFFDYLNTDNMLRCNLNPYGSQSGSFQRCSSVFLFLKSAWMRSLAVPPKGWAYIGIDYKSQEFLIKALQSGDLKMIQDYQTGDVYLAFGKSSKMVPKTATKKTHPIERQACKSSVLGISYDMTEIGLSAKLTNDVGRYYSEEEALAYINAFNETYHVAYAAKEEFQQKYSVNGFARLSDGWTMFGDNGNFRSVGNYPTQGEGGVILRKAIRKCLRDGLKVSIPLHDALYCLVRVEEVPAMVDKMASNMELAFREPFTGKKKDLANVFLDIEVWSPELEEGEFTTNSGRKFKCEKVHIDERGVEDYHNLKKYFSSPDWKLI